MDYESFLIWKRDDKNISICVQYLISKHFENMSYLTLPITL